MSTKGEGGAAYDSDGIHQSLLAGLLSQIGALEEREKPRPGDKPGGKQRRPGPREYVGARGAKFAIFPGSGLARKNPSFLMSAELVETGRLWARQNAEIDPAWAETIGAHLVKRSYSEPVWSRKRGSVMARERVTLYGVPLVADRPVAYGKVDPELSREIFIRHALVYGEWSTRHRFFHDNRKLLEEAEALEHRARRRDLVVDEHTLFEFYDARVGEGVVSGAHFDQWWKQERRQRPDLLTFDPSMLTNDSAEEVSAADYPEAWAAADGLTFPISYHFEPGARDDGLTIDIPLATLNQIDGGDFSWNVPGLREELVTELLRSLPKPLRVQCVPAPNTAREFLAAVPPGEEPLLDALERFLRATRGVHIPRQDWGLGSLPAHLRPTFRVVDESGREQSRGKDLGALKAPLTGEFIKALAEVADDAGLARTGEITWVFGTIPSDVTETRAGHRVTAHPALVDEGRTVGLQIYGAADEAAARHRYGVARLLLIALGTAPLKGRLDALTMQDRLALAGTPYKSTDALLADCLRAVVLERIPEDDAPRTAEAYDDLLAGLKRDAGAAVGDHLAQLLRVLDAWRETDRALSGRVEMALLPALSDLQAQLGRLTFDGFIGGRDGVGPARLRRYPAYLAAMRQRRTKLAEGGTAALVKDREAMDRIGPLQEAYAHRVAALADGRPPGPDLEEVRWMLEEYRISLWSPAAGTDGKVSDIRIRKALDQA